MNWTLHCGDALSVLKTLPEQSVNCVVTSPPYWGLRDYGHASQIGLEPSPEAFVEAIGNVFAVLWPVLKDDGVAWLNLGDSYAAGGNGVGNGKQLTNAGSHMPRKKAPFGYKPKDLVGVPWLAALALRADGWYLRSEVIWAKPNPMPEGVKDRPTKAHETVFLLTKSERYAYNADAIREPMTQAMWDQIKRGYYGEGTKDYEEHGVQNPSSVKARIIAGQRRKVEQQKGWNDDRKDGGVSGIAARGFGANVRSVWTIATEASAYEHFAVMPKELARRCILAGCSIGGTVLDPFAGVCTSGVVALEEGRNFVGIELNPKYHAIGRERLANVAPLLATEATA